MFIDEQTAVVGSENTETGLIRVYVHAEQSPEAQTEIVFNSRAAIKELLFLLHHLYSD